jgi:glycopeptide antibiotics resistance protein
LTKRSARAFLVIWIGVVAVLVVPWWRFQLHPSFEQIQWIPFVSPPIVPRDIVLNAAVYLPIGFWHLTQAVRPSLWRTGVFALTVSLGTEFTQTFDPGRFPSATDVACNTLGALAGALWARHNALRSGARRPAGPSVKRFTRN